jgi:PmbA protein
VSFRNLPGASLITDEVKVGSEKSEKTAAKTIETLRGLLNGKADSYEIFFSRDEGIGVESLDGTVDALKVRSNMGVGLRTISGGRQGFGFSSVLTKEALEGLATSTLSASVEAAVDNDLVLPAAGAPIGDEDRLDTFDEGFSSATEDEKISCAIAIEECARGADDRIKRVRKASYSESVLSTRMVNSLGVDVTHSSTFFSGSVTAVAEEAGGGQGGEGGKGGKGGGGAEIGWEVGMGHRRRLIDPAEIGRGAAKNALRMLGARRIKTVKCPAVIENVVAMELLEALAPSFLADNVHKGKSMLLGKVGQVVASPALNIIDDGLKPGGWATALFDGEGVPRRTTRLLAEGVCQGFLYDSYWAKRAGVVSTGNASRSRYKSMPAIGITNLYIEEGEKTPAELLKEAGTGLFITELLGVHTINSVSGDFSVGAAGLWFEGGEQLYPVRGMAISGNLLELFKKVEACGNDLRFIGSIGAPSFLVSELEASGT